MIKKLYRIILPSQIIMALMMNLNSIIDSYFAGHYLGTEELSAIGFYSPISNVIYLCYIIITGAQIVSCQMIGRGEKEKTSGLFTAGAAVICIFGIIMSSAFAFLGSPIASVVGATGDYASAFALYLLGLSFGVTFMMLRCYFMSFLKINGRNDLVIMSVSAMVVINTILDYLLVAVFNKGIFGLAIASSLTDITVAAIGFTGFIRSEKRTLAVCFSFKNADFKILPAVFKNGMTQFSFNASLIVNNLLINYMLIAVCGQNAVSLMTVFNTFNSFIGVINSGTQETELVIGSLYFGMKNRDGFKNVFKTGIRLNFILLSAAYLVVFIFAGPLSSVYFTDESMHTMSVFMLRAALPSLFPLALFSTFTSSYQCQSKTKFPNIMQYITTVSNLACMAALSAVIGINGLWIGRVVSGFVVLLITYVYIFVCKKCVTFGFEDALLIDDDFGVSPDCVFEGRISSLSEAFKVTKQLEDFCTEKNIPHKTAYHVSLCCAELTENIFKHGKGNNGKGTATLYFIADGSSYTIQILDNCGEFDPVKYMDQFHSEDPTDNIGLKLVMSVASEVKYQRFMEINSVTVIN